MIVKASQIRMMVEKLFPAEAKGIAMLIFPEAYAWRQVPDTEIRLTTVPYPRGEMAIVIEAYEWGSSQQCGVTGPKSWTMVGIWRPGKAQEQVFQTEGFIYAVYEHGKEGTLSIWRCQE